MNGTKGRGMILQSRDEGLLRELAILRVIDREQAKAIAGFGSTTRANARLLALYRQGLIRRFFQGTQAGGRKALYALSTKGARLVGVAHRELGFANDELLATNFFVAHQLAENQIYCGVKFGHIPLPDAKFVRWIVFRDPVAPSLVPDGYFEVSTSQGIVASFIEVDLGQEGLKVWKAKVEKYLQFAASGNFEVQFHLPRFRVLVIANTPQRMNAIREVVRRATHKIFWLSSLEAIGREGFWSSVWYRPEGETTKSFL